MIVGCGEQEGVNEDVLVFGWMVGYIEEEQVLGNKDLVRDVGFLGGDIQRQLDLQEEVYFIDVGLGIVSDRVIEILGVYKIIRGGEELRRR